MGNGLRDTREYLNPGICPRHKTKLEKLGVVFGHHPDGEHVAIAGYYCDLCAAVQTYKDLA